MAAITFRIQGQPAAVEHAAAGLKEIFGLITELTETSDDGRIARTMLTVNGRLNHIGQICLTVGKNESETNRSRNEIIRPAKPAA